MIKNPIVLGFSWLQRKVQAPNWLMLIYAALLIGTNVPFKTVHYISCAVIVLALVAALMSGSQHESA